VAEEEEAPRKSIASKAPASLEPKETDLEEEIGEEELEMEGEIEEDMQEELDLDDENEKDDFIEKSEDLLDDHDDYRNS
jgi:hypothetical protein